MIFCRFQEAMNKPIHAFLPQLPTRGSFVQIDRLRIALICSPRLLTKPTSSVFRYAFSIPLRLHFPAIEFLS